MKKIKSLLGGLRSNRKETREQDGREYLAEQLEGRVLYSGTVAPDASVDDQPVQEAPADYEPEGVGADGSPVSAIEAAQQASAEMEQFVSEGIELAGGETDIAEDQGVVILNPEVFGDLGAISQAAAEGAFDAAAERWSVSGVLTEDQGAALGDVSVEVADLEGDLLVVVSDDNETILLDIDAAGREWFVDGTPLDDSEFTDRVSLNGFRAESGTATQGVDVLTILMEAQGALLGVDGVSAGREVSATGLEEGLRRIPIADEALTNPDEVTTSLVADLANAAAQRWEDSGLSDAQLEALADIEYRVVDLSSGIIGSAEDGVISIDIDAAGKGWFVDLTPEEDSEFGTQVSATSLRATESAATEGIDLLSVIMHEQGHILGLEHVEESSTVTIMTDLFSEGDRRLIEDSQADGAIPGSLEGEHYAITQDALTNGFFASNAASFTSAPGYASGSSGTAGTNPAIDDWTYTGANSFGINGVGISNPFGPSDQLAARYYAFLQRPGTLTQEITLEEDTDYEFGFLAAIRSSNPNAQGRVVIADNSTTYYDSTVTTWSGTAFQAVSAQFTTGASIDGPVTITLSNDSPAGDNTVNYANVFLSEVGVITYDPITGDADSGISSSKTYTHAIDFGRQSSYQTATINGVVFANGGTGAFPDPTGSSQTVGSGTSTLPRSNNDGNGTANPYLNGNNPAAIENLVGDMIWDDGTAEIELTGLSVGASYQFKLYNRPWGIGADRQQTIRFDTDKDGIAEETRSFNADDSSDPNPGFATNSQVYALTYNYTAQSDTLRINIDNHNPTFTYHLYGLTNEVVLDAVDDTSYAGAVVADSPLGYWRLGESAGATVATDSSGNGRDLEYQSVLGANQGQAGATADGDTAIALVNTGADQIQSPNTTDFAFASGESFSIEYWAKFEPGNSTANDAGLITKGYDASESRPWYLSRLQSDGHVELFLRTSSGATAIAESTTNVEDGQWHHVVGVYDATAAEARIYVDGTLEATASGVSAAAYGTNARAFTVGNHLNRQVDGLIDEVAVYGAALTQEQIDAHYAAAPSLMRGTDEDNPLIVAAPGILGNDIPTDAPILGINDTTSLTGTSANGADVTVNADGSFTYDPTVAGATSIQALDEGAMLTDTFTYTTGLYEPIQGQVVRIVQNKPDTANPLQMAEVEVLEFGTGTNLAPAGTASQSSQLSNYGPGLAIDGNYGNFHHTLDQNGGGQTWQVDLGAIKDLDLINIFSRDDCCFQGRTADIQLQVFSDAAATNMVYNERILGIGTDDSQSVRVATLVATDTATVNIEVAGVNDAPVGVDDDGGSVTETADINSNPTTTGNVLTNDTDVDDPNSSFTATPATITGTYGSVVINNDGSFTYTLDDADPDTQALFEGQAVTDTFAYTVNDNHSGGNAKTGTANLTISITGANDAPVLVDDAAVVNEDGPAISIDVFAPAATEAKLTNPVLEQGVSAFSGSIAGTLNDPFAYNPANPTSVLPDQAYSSNGDGFHNNGADAIIRYDVATPVEVNATNQLVVDLFGRADCCQGRDDNIDIEFLDVGGSVVGTIVGTGIGGTEHLRVSSTGVVPDGTTIGGIRVIGHNSAFTLMEIRAAVLVNDTDPDTGDTFTIQSVNTTGTAGLVDVTEAANGIVSYDPNGAFESLAIGETATDTFTYTVIDSNGDTATATVTVTVTGQNDAPTANNDVGYEVDEDGVLTVDTEVNLALGGTASQSSTRVGSGGNVASVAIDGNTDGDFLGGNSVTHTATSGNEWWQVQLDEGVSRVDEIVLYNRTDCCEERLSNFTVAVYNGDPGGSGVEQFSYTHSGTITGTSITIPVDPFVSGDFVRISQSGNILSLAEVQVISFTGVLANDTDPDIDGNAPDDSLAVVASDPTSAKGASVTVNPDGSFEYNPTASATLDALAENESTTDTFTYTISDFSAGRFIKVENNGTANRRMDIGEIEVFGPGATLTNGNAGGNDDTDFATGGVGASIHSSKNFGASGHTSNQSFLIDGAETGGGNTWASSGVGNFVIIDLGENRNVETVRVHQRGDGCCQDRLSNFTVTLLADDGTGQPGAEVRSAVFATQPANSSFGEVTFEGALDTATVTLTVNGQNDAPVLDSGKVNDFNPVSVSDFDNDGDTVADLLNKAVDDATSDVDNGALPRGIAITGSSVTAPGTGTFWFSQDDGDTWNAVGTVSETAALLLLETDRVRFVPDGATLNGGSITFRAWDQTEGTAGGTFNITTTGGTSAFSLGDASSSVTVANVVKDEATNDIVYSALDGGSGEVNHLRISLDSTTGQLVIIDDNGNNISSTEPDFDPSNPGVRMDYTGENLIIRTGKEADIITIGDMSGFTGGITLDGGDDLDKIIYKSNGVVLAAGSDAVFTAEEIVFGPRSGLETTDGDITITGTDPDNLGAGLNYQGVTVLASSLSAGGDGIITITGEGGGVGSNNEGIQISKSSSLTAVDGDIILVGTGGGDAGSYHNDGVTLLSASSVVITGSGSVDITGTGGLGLRFAQGIEMNGSSITVGTGDITLAGTASGTDFGNRGVVLANGSLESAGGNLSVTGTAGAGSSGEGIEISATDLITTGAGTVTLTGSGATGSGTNSSGILIAKGSEISSADGAISIEGTGNGTGSGNHGVTIVSGASISATGAGTLTLTGVGAASTSKSSGVVINNANLAVVDGLMTVTGTGNAATYSRGIELQRNTSLSSTGSGGVTLEGTGGGSATGRYNTGIYSSRADITLTGSGNLSLTGTAGMGNRLNEGVRIVGGSLLTASGTMSITGDASNATSGTSNAGVYILGATLNPGGALSLEGTGGGGSRGYGVFMHRILGITESDITTLVAEAGDDTDDDDATFGNFFA